MKNLADKGYLRMTKKSHAFVYKAAQSADEVRGSVLKNILSKVFLGSKTELIESLVDDKAINQKELAEIEALIQKMKAKS
jgi:predicted transcriptional regulator